MRKILACIFYFYCFITTECTSLFAQNCTYVVPPTVLTYEPNTSVNGVGIHPKAQLNQCVLATLDMVAANVAYGETGGFLLNYEGIKAQVVAARTWLLRNSLDGIPSNNAVAYKVISIMDMKALAFLDASAETSGQVLLGNDPNGTDYMQVIRDFFSAQCSGVVTQSLSEWAKQDCTYSNEGYASYLVSVSASGHAPCTPPTYCCSMPDGKNIYGHGVGMCQHCTKRYSEVLGWNYQEILLHFYTGTCIANVTVSSTPSISSTSTDVCKGQAITLTAKGLGNANWYVYGNNQILHSGTTYTFIPDSTRTYTAKDSGGHEAYYTITVHQPEKFNFECYPDIVYQRLTGYESGLLFENPKTTALEFNNSPVVRPFHDFVDTMLYFVSVTDIHGCKTLDSFLINSDKFKHYGPGDLVCKFDSLTYNFTTATYRAVWTIWNSGGLTTSPVTSYIYDVSTSGTKTIEGSTVSIPALAEGKSVQVKVSFSASLLLANSVELFVVCDQFVGEAITTNNLDGLVVQCEGYPDIELFDGEMYYLKSNDGKPIYEFRAIAKNIGNSESFTKVQYTAFWSRDSIFDSTDYEIGDAKQAYAQIPSLTSGQYVDVGYFDVYAESQFIRTEPGYIFLVADARQRIIKDPNFANNILRFKTPSNKYADLATKISIIGNSPSPLSATKVHVEFGNIGTHDVDSKFISVYASCDKVVSTDDILLYTKYNDNLNFPFLSSLKYSFEITVKLQSLLACDSIYLLAMIDPEQESTEPDELNNTSWVLWGTNTTTSYTQLEYEVDPVIYPNPIWSGRLLHVSKEFESVSMFDLYGNQLCIERNANFIQVPENLAPSTYIIRLVLGGKVSTKKVVVLGN